LACRMSLLGVWHFFTGHRYAELVQERTPTTRVGVCRCGARACWRLVLGW
jgi:hypothetical protein